MKKNFTLILIVLTFHYVQAEKAVYRNGTKPQNNSLQNRAAGCSPATATKIMDFNNVSAIIAQGGLNFMNFSTGGAGYEIPKGSGTKPIYANSLWMAGLDFNGQLKAATIVGFRQNGEEFWPGPLDQGTAKTNEETCAEYDKVYYANRAEVFGFYNDFFPDNNVSTIPENIANWPAYAANGQPLAPFYDANGNGEYDPSNGDMPWFQFKKTPTELMCNNDRRVTMFGDQAYWWVFNDNGNVHTESGGDPIGMEIHAQAFAFNTDDEINDMTFYNYELINRGTQTLYNTYFGNFFDCDNGFANDDFAGCDVSRGLGYVYNGDATDESALGINGYGTNPPAIGVDYFEGPYKDPDGRDNPIDTSTASCLINGGLPYKGLGIGYSDGILDNERFGMLKFFAFTNPSLASNPNMSDPHNAPQAYNYITGFWRDGAQPMWGGNGYPLEPGVSNIPVDYLYYYNTDPYKWASRGVSVGQNWREDIHANVKGDRRFVESSGPFTLKPGAYNNITIGIVYARSQAGDPFSSVQLLLHADDKAQALFDNCFKILEGPNAPDVTVQELNNQIILTLTNSPLSNNAKDDYNEYDPFIVLPDSLPGFDASLSEIEIQDKYLSYKFEGYKIFQLANANIKSGDLNDPDKARLVVQVDKKNEIVKMINWTRDPETGFMIPTLMADGENKGIRHSFSLTTDAFTQAKLVNHKTYYYMAVAYANNNYYAFDPSTELGRLGQQKQYLQSRKNAKGDEIPVMSAIPHNPFVENEGTSINANYGDGPIITRIEGRGNGGLPMNLTPESETFILENNFMPHPQYYGGEGRGPIEVKVIDPLSVTNHKFRVVFVPAGASLTTAEWILIDLNTGDTITSDKTIDVLNEQVFPQYGISITINNWDKPESIVIPDLLTTENYKRTEMISASIEFSDPSKVWLDGVHDQEGFTAQNWIRSGGQKSSGDLFNCDDVIYNDQFGHDNEQEFEKILNGIIAPYHLCANSNYNSTDGITCSINTPVHFRFESSKDAEVLTVQDFGAKTLRSVEIVFTKDKNKWTRCPVLETTDNIEWSPTQDYKQTIKELPSLDKDGNKGDGVVTTDPNDADFIAATGMSWFPGYVIDVETGVRLNVAFGEDSRFSNENGNDMKWNPTSTLTGALGEEFWGGKHFLYIFGNTMHDPNFNVISSYIGEYDFGATLSSGLRFTGSNFGPINNRWRSCSWVYVPMLNNGYSFENPEDMPCDARISLRVKRPYERYNTGGTTFDLSDATSAINNWYNVYEFSMEDLATSTNQTTLNDSILAAINVVPNPYYAYSAYEQSRLDNRIKIVNLPDECTIRIYNVSGGLIRTLTKSTNTITSVDWDLKNQKGVPIAGGVYLIHVEVPEVGERVLKWFGALRPADMKNF